MRCSNAPKDCAISPRMPRGLSGLSSFVKTPAVILLDRILKECGTHTQKIVCELGCMREALNRGIHKAGIPSASVQTRVTETCSSTHRFPIPSVPGCIEALIRVAIVVDLFKEDVLDALDGDVKPLIVRVLRTREVLLLPLMRLKKSVP